MDQTTENEEVEEVTEVTMDDEDKKQRMTMKVK